MSEFDDPIVRNFTAQIEDADSSQEATTASIKNLKTYVETQALLAQISNPEPQGFRGFVRRHGGDLIKGGVTLAVVGIIAGIEAKGDVIFRSKATKYL